MVTSGDAIINEIARRAPGPVFKLGPDRDDVLYADMDLHFSDIEHASFISCTGMFDDDDKPDDYLSRFHGPQLTKKKSVAPVLKVAKSVS